MNLQTLSAIITHIDLSMKSIIGHSKIKSLVFANDILAVSLNDEDYPFAEQIANSIYKNCNVARGNLKVFCKTTVYRI